MKTKSKTPKTAGTKDRAVKTDTKKSKSSSPKATVPTDDTPEPPQIMDPTSQEERERKKNK